MSDNNIVTAVFKDCYDYTTVYGLWQWDYGQILRIKGLSLPEAVEIHFSMYSTGGEAKRRKGITEDGVTYVEIPQSMLEAEENGNYRIHAFIYLAEENSGETVKHIVLQVAARPKPEDYISTPEERKTWEELEERINALDEWQRGNLILTVANGTIKDEQGERVYLQSGTIVTVQAEETNEDGTAFAHWKDKRGHIRCYNPTYTLVLYESDALEAVYDNDAEKTVEIHCRARYDEELDRLVYICDRVIPAKYHPYGGTESGIIIIKESALAGERPEDVLKVDSTNENVKKSKATATGMVSTYRLKVNFSSDERVYGVGYAYYQAPDGGLQVKYSSPAAAARPYILESMDI